MTAMTDYLEDNLLDHVLRNTAYTSPTTIYVALFTTATNDVGGGTEVVGGSYARQTITFSVPTGGVTANDGLVTFPTATGNWGTVTHFALFDAVSGVNMLYHGPMAASRLVQAGDTFRFPISNVTVAHD